MSDAAPSSSLKIVFMFGAICSLAVFMAALGVTHSGLTAQPTPSLTPAHVRVTWERDPHRRATISWTTTLPGSRHRLLMATQPQAQAQDPAWSVEVTQVASGEYDQGLGVYFHHALVEDLQPSTRYYFQVETDAHASQEAWFVTAPTDARRVKLLYGGDSRSDWEDRQAMNRRMALLLHEDPEILALWHGGDFVSDGADWDDWDQWLEDHALTTTPAGRVLPVIPTRGNHERDGEMFNRVFGWPGAPDREVNYFATSIGQWAKLLTLDSQASVFGDQRDWMERTLIRSQDTTWLLAGYHTPAWPAVKIPGPARAWVPYFERYGVDLVCENDGHALKRTVPIRDGAHDPTGVVYVGEGGLGVKQRQPYEGHWYLQSPGHATSAHHVQIISFDAERLTYKAVGMDGAILDTYERAPRARALPPFHVVKSESFEPRGYYLFFSRGLDRDTVDASKISIQPPLPIERFKLAANLALGKLYFGADPEPGATYTLDLSELRDPAGNQVEPLTFDLKIDAPLEPAADMRPPDPTPDMRHASDMRHAPDMATASPDMSAPPDEDEPEDGGGCAAASSVAPAAPGLPAALLGLAAAAWRRRRRPQRATPAAP